MWLWPDWKFHFLICKATIQVPHWCKQLYEDFSFAWYKKLPIRPPKNIYVVRRRLFRKVSKKSQISSRKLQQSENLSARFKIVIYDAINFVSWNKKRFMSYQLSTRSCFWTVEGKNDVDGRELQQCDFSWGKEVLWERVPRVTMSTCYSHDLKIEEQLHVFKVAVCRRIFNDLWSLVNFWKHRISSKRRWANSSKTISILKIGFIPFLNDAYENNAAFQQLNAAINFSYLIIHWHQKRNETNSIS